MWKRYQREKKCEIEQARQLKQLQYREQRNSNKRHKAANLMDDVEFKNRMQKTRNVKKLKSHLPKTPSQRTSVLKSYLTGNSPTVKNLQSLKIIRSKEELTINTMENSVLSDIKNAVKKTRKRRSDENIQSRKVIFATVSGENVANNKCKRSLAKYLGVHRRNITNGFKSRKVILKNEDSCWKISLNKSRCNKISAAIKRIIYDFWLSSGISRPTGNKKDIKRERLDTNMFVSHQIHVLEVTQTDAFNRFKSNFPSIKISQRSFEKLRPFYVRQVRESDRNTCLCRYHVDFKTVFEHCMRERKKLQTTINTYTTEFPVYKSIHEVVECTLCPKEQYSDHYKIDCLRRTCQNCRTTNFKVMDEEKSDESVNWECFEYVTIETKGQCRKKLMLVKKTTVINLLFTYFCKLLVSFPIHQFRSTWQNQQMKYMSTTLPQNDCLVVHDFSENYRVAAKDELQSSYFQRTEVSLHVTILTRHAILEIDGRESSDDNPEIVTEQFLVISNDEKHDHHFVHKVQELIYEYLKSIQYEVKTMHEFTDGCQAQYKSRHCMGDFSHGCGVFGYERVVRNYFETSHAKGPQDAAGGFVKRQLDLAILRGKASIQSAVDVFNFANDNLTTTKKTSTCSRRLFRFLDTASIDRNRGRLFKPIKQNRDIHQLITSKDGVLQLNSLSCYNCEECSDNKFDCCQRNEITCPRNIVLEKENHSITEEETVEDDDEINVADTIKKGNLVIAIYTEEEGEDYYLLKASSACEILNDRTIDAWGNEFQNNTKIVRGIYYKKSEITDLTFEIIPRKQAIVSVFSIICNIQNVKTEKKTELIYISS